MLSQVYIDGESSPHEQLDLDPQDDSSSASSIDEHPPKQISPYFSPIRDALTEKTFCSGTYQVSPEQCVLFYGKETGATGRLNLSSATEDELARFMRVCDPATFGHGQVDVLDESYRKAKKLDTSHFASKFDLRDSGLAEAVRSELLEGEDHLKSINAELYKLNIYDQGAFFKAHKDTPRSEKMFGSLVVVFPTSHEGGALTLRHAGKEWTDVEHEVALVTSGYRVTLTYNLYFASRAETLDDSTDLRTPTTHPSEDSVKTIFGELLADSAFLPAGGKLGFGLNHQYPFSRSINKGMIHRLKGSDALIFRICQHFCLKAYLRVIYKGDEDYIMCPDLASLEDHSQIDDLDDILIEYEHGVRLVNEDDEEREPTIAWVTKITEFNTHKARFVAYGNEASIEYAYGQLVLIAEVGPAAERATMSSSESV